MKFYRTIASALFLLACCVVVAAQVSVGGDGVSLSSTLTINGTPCVVGQSCTVAAATSSIAVGTTITGGTNLRVLYDNNGAIGEYTAAQVTALINLATGSLQGALPAWPNNTTTFFRGDGTYVTLNCAALTNATASCSTDATNATNIGSGTLNAARLPAFGSGDVSFATAGGAGTIAAGAVTNAKLANMANSTIKGRTTAGTGAPEDLTAAQAAAIIATVGGTLKSKLITATRDLTAATGSVAYTGMGFTPTSCLGFGDVSAALNYTSLIGFSDSARTQAGLHYGAAVIAAGNFFAFQDITGANFQLGDIASYDADGVTVTWTKTGSPTGTATIYLLCFR